MSDDLPAFDDDAPPASVVPIPADGAAASPLPPEPVPRGKKRCTTCARTKRLTQFSLDVDQPGERISVCKMCQAAVAKRRKRLSPGDEEKMVIECPHCRNEFGLDEWQMRRMVNTLILDDEIDDPDAPIRALMHGALGEDGAKSIGKMIRRRLVATNTTERVQMRCLDMLLRVMQFHEKSQPERKNLKDLEAGELEAMLAKLMRVPIDQVRFERVPKWMNKEKNATLMPTEEPSNGANAEVVGGGPE
jgi:hypothetical protein